MSPEIRPSRRGLAMTKPSIADERTTTMAKFMASPWRAVRRVSSVYVDKVVCISRLLLGR
jgi:hypothetical protein